MNPCNNTIEPSCAQKKTRAMRSLGKRVRTSHRPLRPLIERHRGMPIGHPNSAVRISSPIALRSASSSDSNQSRSGKLPLLPWKNRAGSLFLSFTDYCTINGTPSQVQTWCVLQRWLGHSSLETTAIYPGVMGAEERLLARRMWCGTRFVNEEKESSPYEDRL